MLRCLVLKWLEIEKLKAKKIFSGVLTLRILLLKFVLYGAEKRLIFSLSAYALCFHSRNAMLVWVLCLSVTSREFFWNGWTNRTGVGMKASTDLSCTVLYESSVPPKNNGTSYQTLNFKNFTTAHRSSQRAVNSVRQSCMDVSRDKLATVVGRCWQYLQRSTFDRRAWPVYL